ncbi:MAG: FeoB-associated Cys-rich membrane protein [Phocaeicola sp.]
MQDIIVWVIVSCCIGYAARNFFKKLSGGKKKSSGCGCNCSGCSMAKKEFRRPGKRNCGEMK